jgi:hypothetical protein
MTPQTHIIIGDTQVHDGVDTTHLEWIGQYIHDKFSGRENITVRHLGDHWDFPSLSWYDRGKRTMEGKRLSKDIDAGNEGLTRLTTPFAYDGFDQRLHRGNHENRLWKAMEDNPQLDGALTFDALNDADEGWTVHDFLEVDRQDGVSYSHYFYHPNTGKPYGGENMGLRLAKIGTTFVQGHQQGLLIGNRAVLGQLQWGVVLGSTYTHHEVYKGPQGNAHWRGILVLYNVKDGGFDPKLVSLDSLAQRYEGIPLNRFLRKKRLPPV